MDVGDPSNLERMRWLFADDLEAMRAAVHGVAFDDGQVREAIRTLDQRYGYVADPHTAIGYLGAEAVRDEAHSSGAPRVVLGTAHPAKFREGVEPVLGRPIPLPPTTSSSDTGPPREP
jgi:threonine synthase